MLRIDPRVWRDGGERQCLLGAGEGGEARQMAAVAQLLHPLWACKWLLSYTGCKQSLKAQDHALRVIRPSRDSQGSRSAPENCLAPSLCGTALAAPLPRSSPPPLQHPTCPLPVPDDDSVTELTRAMTPFVLIYIVLHLHRLCRGLTSL